MFGGKRGSETSLGDGCGKSLLSFRGILRLYKPPKFVLQSIFIAKNCLPGRLLLNVCPDLALSYTGKFG